MLFGRRHDHRLALQALTQSPPMRLFRGTGGGLEIFGRSWGERADALTCVAVASLDAVPRCSAESPLRFKTPTPASLAALHRRARHRDRAGTDVPHQLGRRQHPGRAGRGARLTPDRAHDHPPRHRTAASLPWR
jgi:hypothetical protein